MPRETMTAKRQRALAVAERMNEHYPAAECALHYWGDPFRLTIAVLLSAQTTDKGVNKVTPALWERYPTPADLAAADVRDVEGIIRTIGFFHTKAANVIKCAQMVVADYGGEIPRDIDELQKLPGVGRKTANVVLNEAFGVGGGHRGGHARVPHRASVEVRRPLGRHASEDRGRPAQAVPTRILGSHQPSMGAVRPRNVHRPQPEVRDVLPVRPLPQLRKGVRRKNLD